MYSSHFGFEKHPFYPLSDPDVIYRSSEIREVVCHFFYARDHHEPFFLLTGEVGAGKSTAIRAVIRDLPSGVPVAVMSHSTLTSVEFYEELALQLGLTISGRESKPRLLRELQAALRRHFEQGRQAVLFLDEAHLVSDSVLEEIRLLSNLRRDGHPLLQICLVGQAELLGRLRKESMRPLRQRITSRYPMKPLNAAETAEYLEERLRAAGAPEPHALFEADAARLVHRLSGGIPREINVVANQALLNAFVEDSRVVSRAQVRSIRKDYGFEGAKLPGARAEDARRKGMGRTSSSLLARAKQTVSSRVPAWNFFAASGSIAMLAAGTGLMLRSEERAAPRVRAEAPVEMRAPTPPIPDVFLAYRTAVRRDPPKPEVRAAEPEPEAARSAQPASRPSRGGGGKSIAARYPSTLRVESQTPAVVWLDDERLGMAPGVFSPVPPGRYRLELRVGEDHILRKDVIVTPGSTTFVRADTQAP